MRTTLTWVIAALLLGIAGGVALGYWEARPWSLGAPSPAPAVKEELAAKPSKPGEPQAVIEETIFNFDKMESGAKQNHSFVLKNAGAAPLTVEFVSHTCKCTTVELNGKSVEPGASTIVQPGDSTSILLEWAAKVPAGPFRHGATFTTNDPQHPRIELKVEGDIVESTTLYPSQLSFGSVRVGQQGKAEMFVLSFMEPEVQILSQEIGDPKLAERIQVSIEPAAKDQLPSKDATAGVKVVALYKPGATLGPFVGSLKLKTNLKQAPNLEVPIFGAVKGDISIYGKGWTEAIGVLHMEPTTSATGTTSHLNVALRGPHSKETKLSVASVDPPELKVTLGEPKAMGEKMNQVPLTVEIPPGTHPMVRAGEDQGGEGEIVLATTHPDTKEVRLRVTFAVKP